VHITGQRETSCIRHQQVDLAFERIIGLLRLRCCSSDEIAEVVKQVIRQLKVS
jgi:hypothetical protein